MKLIKKFALISGAFLGLTVLVLSATGIYLYYHPERIKAMLERSLGSLTGSSGTIEHISWSLQPIAIEARGILLKRHGPQPAFSIEVPFIRADMALEGPWTYRTLILQNLQIKGISINFTSPHVPSEKKETSLTARMSQGLVSLFFFREVRLQSGEIIDGHISRSRGDETIQALNIQAKVDAGQPLVFSFAMEAKKAFRNMSFRAPCVTLVSDSVFDINNLHFSGTLEAKNIKLQDAGFGIRSADVASNFTYRPASQTLDAENLEIRCEGIALMPDFKSPLSPIDILLTADGISSRYPVFDVKNAILQIPQAKIHTDTRDILTGNIRFHIPAGHIDTEKQSVSMPRTEFDAFGLKNSLLNLMLKDGKVNLMLQGQGTAILQAAARQQLLPPDWDFSAKDAIRIEASGPLTGPWQMGATLSFEDLAFKNRDESLMGETISLSASMASVVDLEHSSMTFDAALEAKAGEALYDRYYLNLSNNPVVASCKGSYQVQQKKLQLSRFSFNLTDILPIEIEGFLKQGPAADFTVIIPKIPVTPLFQALLQEPYKTQKSFLGNLETGGTVSAEVRIKESENMRQITGRIGWQEGALILPNTGIALKGIHLDLPVWYQTGSAGTPGEVLNGNLTVRSATVPPLPEQALSILMNAGPNRISVDSSTVIRIPGGNLLLGPVQVENVFSPDISARTRLAVGEIKLQPLLSGIGVLSPDGEIKGTLTGTLDPIRYEHHTVVSQGEIAAEVFGGDIILSDLGASGIFTPAPVFKLNAHWLDLLLAEITTDTAFGKIEGVLKGHIRDFEIASGQPQKFDLLIETVPQKGIPQTISLKAIDNIAQIGGGQSPFMGLAGSFASVFKKFPYEKIGIRAYLENDMFTINGTSKEGRTEYLVKRGSFSGVNIINQNPDNRISFKDMVKRIQRITRKGGAVVN